MTELKFILKLIFAAVVVGFVSYVLYGWGAFGGRPAQQKALFMAAFRGDTNEVSRLLNSNVDPNIRHHSLSEETPLIVAVKFGFVDMAHDLLKHGADPNVADYYGRSPLYYSMTSIYLNNDYLSNYVDSSNIVQMLIDNGADLSAKGVPDVVSNMDSNDLRIQVYRRALSKARGGGDNIAKGSTIKIPHNE